MQMPEGRFEHISKLFQIVGMKPSQRNEVFYSRLTLVQNAPKPAQKRGKSRSSAAPDAIRNHSERAPSPPERDIPEDADQLP